MCHRKTRVRRFKCYWQSLFSLAIILPLFCSAEIIPSPKLPYGNDSIRTPDGFQCSTSVSPQSYIDAGVYQEDTQRYNNTDRGIYARIFIPLGSNKNRIDCVKLYEQALEERKREKSLNNIKRDVFSD